MRPAIVTLGLSLVFTACSPTARPEATPQAELQATHADITAACGGGVTGGSEGITITAADHVVSWEQVTPGASRTETDLGADPVYAADVRRQLDMIHFADVVYSEAGNMTCSLTVGDHSVSWAQGDAAAPAAVVAVQERVFTSDGRE